MRLRGRSALVIGAASGFGAQIACAFARDGAKVTIMDLSGEGAIKVAGEAGPAAIAVDGGVTRRDDIDAASRRLGCERRRAHHAANRRAMNARAHQ